MNEINFQRSSQSGRVDYLFAIDDIEMVNEEAKMKKFETIFRKKLKRSGLTEDESDEFLSRVNSDFDEEADSIELDSNFIKLNFRQSWDIQKYFKNEQFK